MRPCTATIMTSSTRRVQRSDRAVRAADVRDRTGAVIRSNAPVRRDDWTYIGYERLVISN